MAAASKTSRINGRIKAGIKNLATLGLALIACFVFYVLTSVTISEVTKGSPDTGNITGLISAWTSIIALAGAITAYQTWVHKKIKEDAYEFIKKYVVHMCDLEYEVVEIFTRLDGLRPQSGMIPIEKDHALAALDETWARMSALNNAIKQLHIAKIELKHWDVELTSKGEELHSEVMRSAMNFANIFHIATNSTGNYYRHIEDLPESKVSNTLKSHISESMFSSNRHLKKVAEEITGIFEKRRLLTFKNLFAI